MKVHSAPLRSLALILVACATVACDGNDTNAAESGRRVRESAKELAGDTKRLAGELAERAEAAFADLREIDVEELARTSKAKLSALGTKSMEAIRTQLERVEDAATAERFRSTVEPLVDKLASMKDALGEQLPEASEVRAAIRDFRAKYANEEAIMGVLRPVLEKLENLFSRAN